MASHGVVGCATRFKHSRRQRGEGLRDAPPKVSARHPPLACRPSPPQGGRSDVAPAFADRQRREDESRRASGQRGPCDCQPFAAISLATACASMPISRSRPVTGLWKPTR
ncbi:hypothetical protein EN852_009280 [Mesorhizobium sp. M2E.F.Ca.ET.209.01.1.1]|nr:hypothetical protein EN852_009280 [Mesorhizobium sp. M2E.F.Ca.ET.209.01.1.1]